ncbi:glycosyltransferase [Acerihabitans arboris]|nr:glycosyltransferase [Acerihabitans arboris]
MCILGKKIIYVINSLHPGGAEMGLETLISNGLFADTQLHIVCLTKSSSNLEQRIEKISNIEIIYLSHSEVKNKKIFNYALSLYKIIKNIRPDIVIASLSQSVIVTRMVKLLYPSFNHITFEHNTHFSSRPAWYLLKATDFLTNIFWCDSIATRRSLLARRKKAKNIVLNLFFVQSDVPIKQIYSIDQQIKLMAVGRLMTQKNYPQLIDVVNNLCRQNVDIELTIYGDGELLSHLKQIVADLRLDGKIIFRGFVDNWISDAAEYDAYILMSDFEGLSIATLEAMSIGLPCIVKPVGELSNYVSNGITGMTVETVYDAVNSIIELKHDDILRIKLGQNGRKYVADNYSQEKFLKQISKAKTSLEKLYEAN